MEVRTGVAVSGIDWERDPIIVRARSSAGNTLQFASRQVIITVPVGVLQQEPSSAEGIRFEPELSTKKHALSCVVMGPVVRIILQFDSMFWGRSEGYGQPSAQ